MFVFSRFLVGFIFIFAWVHSRKKNAKPKEYKFLFVRALTNVLAVYTFFKAVEVETLAEANILNMTYPVFIALLSLIFIPSQRDFVSGLIALLAFFGVYLVLRPDGSPVSAEVAFWGLLSGLTASVSLISLNFTRQKNSVETVLCWLYGLGTLVTLVLFAPWLFFPLENSSSISFFAV